MIMPSQKEKLKNLESYLKSRIKGQDRTLVELKEMFYSGEIDLRSDGRPKASFLFMGPTGVGKTEVVKAVTEYIFGPDKLYRFNMSEFLHIDSVKEFRGDEAGSHGRLGDILEKHTDGTLLFDEMEKAHPDILTLFLQMLDAAQITLGNKKTYDLSNFYMMFTSNVGGIRIMNAKNVSYSRLKKMVELELIMATRPEFANRFSNICVFRALEYDVQKTIAVEMLKGEINRMNRKGYKVSCDNNLLNFVIRKGINRAMGARPLRDVIEKSVQNAISKDIIDDDGTGSGEITADLRKNLAYIKKPCETHTAVQLQH
ncbi:MAG TPA: AAA family ATPase [Victivallales bacterium]|jgi:ATP-dependent Clp protease ATP-binding subunit ClpB|nr:AAA family ATPase [Victivallales bacterium]